MDNWIMFVIKGIVLWCLSIVTALVIIIFTKSVPIGIMLGVPVAGLWAVCIGVQLEENRGWTK